MKRFTWMAVAVCAFLSACSDTPLVSNIASQVTGTVFTSSPEALPEGSVLTIKLMDANKVKAGPKRMGQTIIDLSGQIAPFNFSIAVDTDKIDSRGHYFLRAEVNNGSTITYYGAEEYKVLTNGAPAVVKILLLKAMAAPVSATPAEKLEKYFANLETQIGGMRRIQGDRVPDEANNTIGWDAFIETDGEVQMVRENETVGENVRIKTRYAYQNGEPLMLVRRVTDSSNGKQTTNIRVGWDDLYQVIIREKSVNGQSAELSDAEIEVLRSRAATALKAAK